MADITLINLNMLYIRYGEQTERNCTYLWGLCT